MLTNQPAWHEKFSIFLSLSMTCMLLLVQLLKGLLFHLFCWESPKMRYYPLSCFLIKSCGLRIGWKLVYVDHENDVLLVGMILGRSLWTGYTASRSFILKKSSR
ncbi:unnamed protein product, partial [Vitis vinifera]|uniref:Uncharacterized protein n=1 Tax=Vitis vinifera TaxID=29760 RepID=D7SP67_VITVI